MEHIIHMYHLGSIEMTYINRFKYITIIKHIIHPRYLFRIEIIQMLYGFQSY